MTVGICALRIGAEVVFGEVRVEIEQALGKTARAAQGLEVTQRTDTAFAVMAVHREEVRRLGLAGFNELAIVAEANDAARPDFEAVVMMGGRSWRSSETMLSRCASRPDDGPSPCPSRD